MANSLKILHSVDEVLAWLEQHQAQALTADSRKIQAGHVFIAWPGYATDGRQYVRAALSAGAVACVVEAEGADRFDYPANAPVVAVPGLKALTGELAHRFYGEPSGDVSVMAITGTNGKTSTSWWLAQALTSLGQRAGVIGTLGVGIPPNVVTTGLTTPDPITLHQTLKGFRDQGLQVAVMEASSIGLVEQRMTGTRVAAAIYTNLTLDHLDYHKTMVAYRQAKESLFSWPNLRSAVINCDDEVGKSLYERLLSKPGMQVMSYGMHEAADLQAKAWHYSGTGLSFEVYEHHEVVTVRTQLIGEFNVSNLLAVMGGLRVAGFTLEQAAQACEQLKSVPGRMQLVNPHSADEQPLVVVDYAHTPDALEKALQALRPLVQARGGELWCMFGCGGNRDASKRPVMGQVSQEYADHVIVTSDNPRDEAPQDILRQITQGMIGVAQVMEDRAQAIRYALTHAKAHDVILLAGKGHETYQEIKGVKHPFSDVDEALTVLREWGVRA